MAQRDGETGRVRKNGSKLGIGRLADCIVWQTARIVFCRRLQLKDLVPGLGKAVKVPGVLFTLGKL